MPDDPTPEEQAAAEKAAAEKAAADAKAAADKQAAEKAAEADKLGDPGKAALDAERKARREAEKRAKEAEERAKAFEDKEKSELQLAQERVAALQAETAKAAEKVRRANLLAELSKPDHGLASAKAALKLIDGVEYDDDGEPVNSAERIAALLEEHPFLKANGGNGGSPANPGRDKGGLSREQIAALAKSDPEQFNKRFEAGEFDTVLTS